MSYYKVSAEMFSPDNAMEIFSIIFSPLSSKERLFLNNIPEQLNLFGNWLDSYWTLMMTSWGYICSPSVRKTKKMFSFRIYLFALERTSLKTGLDKVPPPLKNILSVSTYLGNALSQITVGFVLKVMTVVNILSYLLSISRAILKALIISFHLDDIEYDESNAKMKWVVFLAY